MPDDSKIAIIGYAASLPGCSGPESLWLLTSQKKEGIRHYRQEEISAELPESFSRAPAFRAVGGGPEDYRCFDAGFFGYSPKEASYLDPQIRKSLEYAWLACEHAGYAPDGLSERVGVYSVSAVNSYFNENLAALYHQRADPSVQTQLLYLNESDFIASRIAYHFNWQGVAVNLRCGCSSSLVAVHEASKSLLNYDVDIALVGGAVIKPRYQYGYHYEHDGIQSDVGHCSPFSDSADGTVFTNGAGFLVLRRYEDAVESNDTIHAVVAASAVNNDGSDKVGYMAPSVSGQVKAIQNALADAEIEPGDVGYIEAHGTGTKMGDPIEFEALMKVYGGLPRGSIALSTVKANIGHLDALSGLAGVLKVIGDLQHRTISPQANYDKPNQAIDLDRSPFTIPQRLMDWESSAQGPRIATVSSFGVGGTNSVVVLEEAPVRAERPARPQETCFAGLSARTPEALSEQIEQLAAWLAAHPDDDLHDIAWTLLLGRSTFRYRWGRPVASVAELQVHLAAAVPDDFVNVSVAGRWSLKSAQEASPEQLATFWLGGGTIETAEGLPSGCRRLPLPGYPFERREHWIAPEELTGQGDASDGKISDIAQWFYTPTWKKQRIAAPAPDLSGRTVLMFRHQDAISAYFADLLRQRGATVVQVSPGTEYTRLSEGHYQVTPGDERQMAELLASLRDNDELPDWITHFWCLGQAGQPRESVQAQGLYTMVALCKAYDLLGLTVGFDTILVTDRSVSIVGTEEIEPIKSTLIGISQVLPKEYQGTQCNLVDIDPEFQREETGRLLLAEMGSGASSEVALRGAHRFVKDYVRYTLPADRVGDSLLQGGGAIVIFGGLGNFGLELAEFVTSHYDAHVYLTTRTNFPARERWTSWLEEHSDDNTISQKIRRLRSLEASGGRVDVLTADVTRRTDVERVKQHLDEHNERICGVIHAAGTVDSGMIRTRTPESLEQVFAAKIDGTINLCDVFLPQDPAFMLLCSSMNSIIGGLGQLDNTAANAFVDAWAEHCHQIGKTQVLAINWGAVNEARARNYASLPQFKELSEEHVRNKMTQEEIFEVYRRLFSSSFGSRLVVSTLDFNKVIENWSRVGSIEALARNVTSAAGKREEFVGTDWEEPTTPYEISVARHWQTLLGIDRVGNDDNFFELGGNSLIVLQAIELIKDDFPIRMHAMAIYEHPTVKEFGSHIEQLVTETLDKSQIS
ncbi:SDR family oxidoreductase [Streptomyces huasconensis]|uniref:SDR family oxidoreductase n=1 Tax=Streptomyces huasconensis TaxID=1854574 RepID=UPI00340850D6